jgi:hypothetical protein
MLTLDLDILDQVDQPLKQEHNLLEQSNLLGLLSIGFALHKSGVMFFKRARHWGYARRAAAAANDAAVWPAAAEFGVKFAPVVGRKLFPDPPPPPAEAVNAELTTGAASVPSTQISLEAMLPAPGATEVGKLHGGVSLPVSTMAAWGTPEESVTTTEVPADAAPLAVGAEAPLVS